MSKLARLAPVLDPSTPSRVLLVDDSLSLQRLLRACIERVDGITVESADSFAQTQQLLANAHERFACAVLDLNLPDAPNGEVVDLVRALAIPIIVLTGSDDEPTRLRMQAANVIDYVIKGNAAELEHVAYLVARLRENHQTKVIVTDDSVSFRTYLKWLLENYRYTTLVASNGREALELLEANPDTSLVITDLHMPVMDGMELIAQVRKDYRREDLAIIGVSDGKQPRVSASMIKAGANDFLNKPFQVEEFYCRVTQNTNMVGYVRQIREAATRDFLTGLYNRRHIFEVGQALYANACRGNINLATALIDADHFKRINDCYGHQVGDQALRAMAQVIQRMLRTGDVVGRYGGEEIVCLTMVKQHDHAPIAFERVRRAIEAIELQAGGQRVPITVSVGVTVDRCESLEQMIRRADEAVYRAKESGRNRVVCM